MNGHRQTTPTCPFCADLVEELGAYSWRRSNGPARHGREVRKVPQTDSCTAANKALFDHLVGAGEHCSWDGEAKRLGRLEIDDEIKFGGLFDWDVGRLRPTQNLVDEFGGAAEEVRVVCSIGDQTTRLHVLPGRINCRQSRALCQSVDMKPMRDHQRIGNDTQRLCSALEPFEGGRNIIRSPDFRSDNFEAESAGRCLNLAYFQDRGGIAEVGHDRQSAQTRDNLAQEFESL